MKHLRLTIILVFLIFWGQAQDSTYIRNCINTLTSENFYGRGYVKKGDALAARFLQKELEKFNVLSFEKRYKQAVSFPINTFPGKMHIDIDDKELLPVFEYVISPNCPTVKGKYKLHYLPEAADSIDAIFDSIVQINYGDKFLVAPFNNRKLTKHNPFVAAGVIVPRKSSFWWASTGYEVVKTPLIIIKDSIIGLKPETIDLEVENKYHKNYESQNIVGYIPGTLQSDSIIVFSAHYDHLGTMGKENIFIGANDNCSGTSMLLGLAKYYSTHKPKYTTVFLFFTGEEAGLIGSRYFVENPLFDLSRIKALINLDMIGSGSEGIAIVNGKNTPEISQKIKAINEKHNYFPAIQLRGESCNSDHCFFHKAGVPSVFIYTKGKEHTEYHNLNDSPENLPLTKFNELFKLLVEFAD